MKKIIQNFFYSKGVKDTDVDSDKLSTLHASTIKKKTFTQICFSNILY